MDFPRCEEHTKEHHRIATCTFEILCENTNRRAMVVGVYDD